MARTRQRVKLVLDEPTMSPRWLVVLLVLSSLSLLLQLFPRLRWAVVAVVDVRDWSWRSYSALFAAVIVLLVAVRAWQERSH